MGEFLPAVVRVPKAAELVASQLRKQIVRGELRGGDALPPESRLIEDYGISRPTLREALRILESESLITIRRGAQGGARVQVPTAEAAARYAGFVLQFEDTTVTDVYEARAILEPQAAGVLATRPRAEVVAQLRTALAEAESQSTDAANFIAFENAFHSLLMQLAGNKTMFLLSRVIDGILDKANYSATVEPAGGRGQVRLLRSAQRSHEKVVDLIEAGDSAAAEDFWRRHVSRGGQEIVKRLPAQAILDIM